MARLPLMDVFGLHPLPLRFREMMLALRGDGVTPKTRVGLSSRALLKPALSLPLWLGRRPKGRLIPMYNLFNHEQPDLRKGWSVEKTKVRDFRGGDLTYDSHNGTDFAVPPGTRVVAAAPGVVLRCSNEFHRGGLKVFLDHGDGLVTTYNHLATLSVKLGDVVKRGQEIARSGASGIDGFLLFPWSTPHLHFNVWLDGRYVDPFPYEENSSLWEHGHRHPRPAAREASEEVWSPTVWDSDRVSAQIESCVDAGARKEIEACTDLPTRAMTTLFQRNYFPTRFREEHDFYGEVHPRSPRLSLPFHADDYDGITFI